jgi:hypothetical protein
MGDTFNNSGTFSGSELNLTQGANAIGKQYNTAQQIPVDELLKLLAEIKAQLPSLPEEQRAEVQNEVEGAELQARKAKPDAGKIAAKLTSAQDILKAIPGMVVAALPVGELLGKALIWCSKAVGM